MVIANFKDGELKTQTTPMHQWDYGQKLRIQGLKLPSAVEIHFAEANAASAITRLGITTDGVTDAPIPDQLFEQKETVLAYVYLTDETSGLTIYKITIPVIERAKPEEWSEPETKEIFEEVLAQLKTDLDAMTDLKENSVTDIDNAKTAALEAIAVQQALENSATSEETLNYINGQREDSQSEKRVTLEDLAAIIDDVKSNVLGGLIFSVTEEKMLSIKESNEEEGN